jgi:hypothetical protein
MYMKLIPGPNNEMITASVAPAYGSTANYYQGTQGSKTIATGGTFPKSVVSGSITTYGNPVLIMCTGDANPASAGTWGVLQLYRDTTALCQTVQYESSDANENVPYSINCVDPVGAGTYTYYMKVNDTAGGNTTFGEVSGPNLILMEIGRV